MNALARPRRDQGWRPADAPGRPVLFVNPRSGGGKAARAGLADRARDLGIEVHVLGPGDDLGALAAAAAEDGADTLGMAGGDGSLAAVASAAYAHDVPFVCLPAGTRNHFALDNGVLRHDLLGALAAFTHGLERRIDVAQINDRLFLNNVSLGVYGDAVQQSTYRDAKLRTLLETARDVIGPDAAARGIRFTDDRGDEHRDPALVLVSNNPYSLARPVAHGSRARLDTGRLGIVALERPAARRARPDRAWSVPEFDIAVPAAVDAALDGEAVRLDAPLRFSIRHLALRVRISARHPGIPPAALLGPGPPG